MFPLGLKRTDLRAFHRALADSHSIRVRVYVLDMVHDRMANLSDEFIDGQVNVDADAQPTRSATLTFYDRRKTMDFDSDSPSNGALFANRMLRVTYGVKVSELAEWVDVPVFTGPVIKVDRTANEVTVECQGKEVLAMGAGWRPMTIKKGVKKVDAIRRIMRERGGEHRFDLPDLDSKLPKAVSLGRETQPWAAAQKIARSMNRHLFYDGAGVCRLRRYPDNPVFKFRDGQLGTVAAPPQVSFSMDDVRNAVWVKGGVPKAKKKDATQPTDADGNNKKDKERGVRHFETAPRSHPLSPWRLGRPDAPRFLLEVIENDSIRSEKEARQVAHRVLHHRLRQLVDVTFDSLPVPHLEPEDMVRVDTHQFAHTMRLGQFSLPLRHDSLQSVGYTRKVSVRKRRRNKP